MGQHGVTLNNKRGRIQIKSIQNTQPKTGQNNIRVHDIH